MMRSPWFAVLLLPGLAACTGSPAAPAAPEATSLLGEPLWPPPLDEPARLKREGELALARSAFDLDPRSEENIIWLGRRLAYLGRFRAAIEVYTNGLASHPRSFKLLRHRGHRYITLRQFDLAIADLTRAAQLCAAVPDEVEPDGLPNARNSPTGTARTNIYYHLGLALYLEGRYEEAAEAYRRCLEHSTNDDMRVAASYWLYLALRRAGRSADAEAVLLPVSPGQDVFENFAYHRLLLLFKGEMSPEAVGAAPEPSPVGPAIDDATLGYGLGAWHLANGRREAALAQFRRVLDGGAWPAFGHVAAEREVAAEGGLLMGGP
jgi:tetratricopeptide (TPR) repeat protein